MTGETAGRRLSTIPDTASPLSPYLPRLAIEWPEPDVGPRCQQIEGTLVFADVSGFTRLSERLARRGRAGAEEVTDVIGGCFGRLLDLARDDGGSLLKFGGDALLLVFAGARHAKRGCRAAARMRREMRTLGSLTTSVGTVRLRIKMGVHSGPLHFFRVGEAHRELIVTGPGATTAVAMEHGADAGDIVLSPATADQVDARLHGHAKGAGWLLRDVDVDLGEGSPLLEPQLGSAADPSTAIPVALRAHLASGQVEPEHRNATIAFLRYSSVDALLAGAGADAVAAALDDLVRLTQRHADEEGVTFLTSDVDTDGGKLILLAGVPTARDDDEGRLLRAVRRIADDQLPLPVQIGVNRGPVFAGAIGPAYRQSFTVMGDAVNVAARLMAAARPGQILASRDLVQRSRARFHTTPLDPLTVKGKSTVVHACVLGAFAGRPRAAEDAHDGLLPLVGRNAEAGALAEAVTAARAGSGTFVEVVGGAGIGKSRLVRDVLAASADLPSTTVASETYEQSTPYYTIAQLLRELLGLGDIERESWPTAVVARISAVAPDLVPWLPLLAVPLAFETEPTPETADLEPRSRSQRTLDVIAALLEYLLPGPALVVFEDAQWMDAASAGVLTHLATTAASHPWVVCVVRRDDAETAAPLAPESLVLRVAPLTVEQSLAAVTAATDDAPLRPHEAAALVERAGGNPLYLGELLRAQRDTQGALPDSLEGVVSIQVDRLDPPDRRLLRSAAVLGVSFPRALLVALAGDHQEPNSSRQLDLLGEFLETDAGDRVRFRNPLTRDVVYNALSFRRRRELHSLAADAIKQARHSVAGDQAEALSAHYLAAGRHRDAWRYAMVAAPRAQATYANVDAAELYERALAAARQLPDLPPSQVAAAWEALGDVRELVGAYESAAAAFAAARRLVPDHIDRAPLFLKSARVAERQGRYSSGLRWARLGLRLLDGIDGKEAAAHRAGLSAWYATVRKRQGRQKDAIRWSHDAIAQAKAGDNRVALAQAYRILDWAYVVVGRFDLAVHSAAALDIYEQMGDLSGQGDVLNNLGAFAYFQGHWDEALACYTRARDAKARIGNAVDAAAFGANMAEILTDQGRLDEADASFREALRIWRASGYGRWIAWATMHLGRIAARRAQFDDALEFLAQAREGFASIDGAAEVLETDVWSAECLVLKGDSQRALDLIDDCLMREAAMGGANLHRATLQRLRGYACARLGRLAEALAALDDSLVAGRARGAEFEVALTLEARSVIAPLTGEVFEPPGAEHRVVLERLGIRSLPSPPLSSPLS